MPERTLILIRPDGVRRRLVDGAISRPQGRKSQVTAMRMLAFDRETAAPGTIRTGDALQVTENVAHGPGSPDSAAREIKIFFPEIV